MKIIQAHPMLPNKSGVKLSFMISIYLNDPAVLNQINIHNIGYVK